MIYSAGAILTRYWVVSGVFNYFTHWVVTSAEVEALLPPLEQRFVQEAAAAIYANGHDTLTFLAELASVRDLFMSAGKKILGLGPPKRRYLKVSRKIKATVNDWLVYRYGWRTLVYDLQSLYKAIQNLNCERTRYSEKKGNTTSSTVITEWSTYQTPSYADHVKTDTITTGVRGAVVADITIPQFQFNPIQTGWELIPYSFVVDWFVSVGKALAAASFLVLQQNYSASVGHFAEVERQYTMQHRDKTTSPAAYGSWTQEGSCKAKIERRVPCSVPLSPQFRVNLNPGKIMDLLALVVQRT